MNRRSFLRISLAAPCFLRAAVPILAEAQSKTTEDASAKRIFNQLKGPMGAITIPYNKDYSIDYGSLRGWVDFMCESKIPVLFHTYGDGEIYNLNEREVETVIRTVARQARGRSLVIGGTPHGWTGQTVDFVNRLEDSGVDAVNVHVYNRNEEEIYRALSLVAEETRLPLLAYEMNFSVDLVKRIAQIPGMIAIKHHAELYRYYDSIRATREDHFGILGAGQMRHFLFGYLIGSTAYLCPLTPFAPQIGLGFYQALQKRDLDEARRYIFEYEEPLLKITIPLGYPMAYKSALYLTGHYKTNLVRPPKKTNSSSEIEPLRVFLHKKELL